MSLKATRIQVGPLVSAVIPTRNRPALVCRAVRSALNQTWLNLEVIVVVDGPDPATVEALEALTDSRVRVVALPENVGGSEARNIGVRSANGKYIALLDDDDTWLPDKLSKQVAILQRSDARPQLVTCKHILRRQGKDDIVLPARAPGVDEHITDYMFYARRFEQPAYGPQTSTYFAERALFLANPFRKGLICHQDWDWFLRIVASGRADLYILDEPLSIVHVDSGQASVTSRTRWKDSLEWLESSSFLFTPKAFSSFIVHQCMYRCAETRSRLRTFLGLIGKCKSFGYIDFPQILLAAKWLALSPSMRSYLKENLNPRD